MTIDRYGSLRAMTREQLLDWIRPVLVCPTPRRGPSEHGGDLAYGTCDLAVRGDGAFSFADLSDRAQNADWLNAVSVRLYRALVPLTTVSGFAIETTLPGGAPAR